MTQRVSNLDALSCTSHYLYLSLKVESGKATGGKNWGLTACPWNTVYFPTRDGDERDVEMLTLSPLPSLPLSSCGRDCVYRHLPAYLLTSTRCPLCPSYQEQGKSQEHLFYLLLAFLIFLSFLILTNVPFLRIFFLLILSSTSRVLSLIITLLKYSTVTLYRFNSHLSVHYIYISSMPW